MLAEIPAEDDTYRLYGDSLTAAIFAIAFETRETHARSGTLTPWRLNRVTEYMLSRLPEQVELQELAALAGLSQWHFCRAFKASTGVSPYQWQLDERMKMVQRLLLNSEIPLEAVAEATGFSDSMHLIRTFKKRSGETPGAWRRKIDLK